MKRFLIMGALLGVLAPALAAPKAAPKDEAPQEPPKSLNLPITEQAKFDPEAAQALAKQCDAIFETRKQEIALALSQLQQQQSTLQVITAENTKLLKEKENQLKLKERAVRKLYAEMKEEQAKKEKDSNDKLEEAKGLLERNQEVLNQINAIKENKLSESYAKMKEAKAAAIISALPDEDALAILLSLKPNQMGGILSQMQPNRAAELSTLIRYYPNKKPQPPEVPPPPTPDGLNVDNVGSSESPSLPSSGRTSGDRGTTIY